MPQLVRLFGFLGMLAGGWIGWWIGRPLSLAAGLLASIVGTGLGLWAGRVVGDRF